MIELSEKLSRIRLNELRSNREAGELKEKQNYLSRLLKQQIDHIKKLEEQNSEFESRMHKREEEFRRADNDRMRRFFNAKFDDISGALGNNQQAKASPAFSGGFAEKKSLRSPASFSRQQSHSSNSDHDTKFLEGKVKKLQDELRNATDEIRSREAIINRFKEWQLADKYLS